MKRTALRKTSKKRARELAKYWPLRKKYLERGKCEWPLCPDKMVDIHHCEGRGKNLNNVSTWIGLCRFHHTWIHSHTREARKLGLLSP